MIASYGMRFAPGLMNIITILLVVNAIKLKKSNIVISKMFQGLLKIS
jgi:hypothetical protein